MCSLFINITLAFGCQLFCNLTIWSQTHRAFALHLFEHHLQAGGRNHERSSGDQCHHLSWSSLAQLKGLLITSAVSLAGNIHRSSSEGTTRLKLDPIFARRPGRPPSSLPNPSYHIAAYGTCPCARVGRKRGQRPSKAEMVPFEETDSRTLFAGTARQCLPRFNPPIWKHRFFSFFCCRYFLLYWSFYSSTWALIPASSKSWLA